MKLFARYDVKFSGHLLFMLSNEKDESITFENVYNDFTVNIMLIFDKSGGVRAPNEEHYSYGSNFARVMVSREESDEPPSMEDKDYWRYFNNRENLYADAAINVLNRLIRFFKFRLGNPLLCDFTPYDDPIFINPIWMDQNGNQLDSGYDAHFGSQSRGIDSYRNFSIESYSESIHNNALQAALQNLYEPKLYEEILSDAKTAIMQNNFRRAILEMAIACEIYVKQSFFYSSESSSAVFDYLEEKRKIEISIPELIHGIAKHVFGESFKEKFLNDFHNIEYLFRARNKIAHTGYCFYRDVNGKKQKIYQTTLNDWWKTIDILVKWLEQKLN